MNRSIWWVIRKMDACLQKDTIDASHNTTNTHERPQPSTQSTLSDTTNITPTHEKYNMSQATLTIQETQIKDRRSDETKIKIRLESQRREGRR
jgi:hypothetical protein